MYLIMKYESKSIISRLHFLKKQTLILYLCVQRTQVFILSMNYVRLLYDIRNKFSDFIVIFVLNFVNKLIQCILFYYKPLIPIN